MATIGTYLEMVEQAYSSTINSGWEVNGFPVREVYYAMKINQGIKAVVFEREEETIIAFPGTLGNIIKAPWPQIAANARLGLGIVPNVTGRAWEIVRSHSNRLKRTSLVGHSSGGSLVQIVGAWTGHPFISLNGPGAGVHLALSRYNVAHPEQLLRTRAASSENVVGISFNTANDRISGFGRPLGRLVEVGASASGNHRISAIRDGLADRVEWSPVDFNPDFWSSTAGGGAT